MELLFGVIVGLILVAFMNQAQRRKTKGGRGKKKGDEPQGRSPIQPYRWTPPEPEQDQPEPEEMQSGSDPSALPAAAPTEDNADKNLPEAKQEEELPASPDQSAAGIPAADPEEALKPFGEIRTMGEAGLALSRLSGQDPRPYSTIDFGSRRLPQCLSVLADQQKAWDWVGHLQPKLVNGLLAFVGTVHMEDDNQAEVVIGRGETPYDAIRLAQTNAIHHDLSTEDIVKKLKEWDGRYGISIKSAATDTVGFTLLKTPEDVPAFRAELYAFCPDLSELGLGSTEALDERIASGEPIVLHWN